MNTVSPMTFDAVMLNAKSLLTAATKDFTKAPTADRWNAMQAAMLMWQQLHYLRGNAMPNKVAMRHALTVKLAEMPNLLWPEVIVREVLGLSVGQALNPSTPL